MTNWKLVSDVSVYLSENGESAWISSSSEKKQKKLIESKVRKSCLKWSEKSLENEFSIEFTKELEILISSTDPELEGKWKVENLDVDSLGSIISQVTLNKGKPGDDLIFEVAINPEETDVRFVTDCMDEYSLYLDEMIRQVNCASLKKTVSWKPGHRYDGPNETIYYLGSWKSHKESIFSEYHKLDSGKVAYLVTKSIKGCKTVSDVFKTQPFGEGGIEVRYSRQKLVDSGEKLVDDMSDKDLSTLWSSMFRISPGITSSLDILAYTNNEPSVLPSEFLDPIKDRIVEVSRKLVLRDWNIDKGSSMEIYRISDKLSDEDNVAHLLNLVWQEIEDPNYLAPVYYTDLFLEYDIDFKDELLQVIKEFDYTIDVLGSWENYMKNGKEYFRYHFMNESSTISCIRSKTYVGYYTKPAKKYLKDIYRNHDILREVLIKFFKESVKSEGYPGVNFCKYNMGTRKNPNNYITVVADLDSLTKWTTEMNLLTDDLKNEIIQAKFLECRLELDEGESIE